MTNLFDNTEGPDSNEVHKKSDVDSSPFAQHHTLGPGRNQAASGDHLHMFGVTITGSKGGNVALANLITALAAEFGFTDGTT